MKILIADDHAVVRHGLKQILADEFKKSVFGEAGNAQEALELVWKEPWDVVVLDITMPGRSGLEVLREIKKFSPKLPVLVLSMHPENQFAVRVLKRWRLSLLIWIWKTARGCGKFFSIWVDCRRLRTFPAVRGAAAALR